MQIAIRLRPNTIDMQHRHFSTGRETEVFRLDVSGSDDPSVEGTVSNNLMEGFAVHSVWKTHLQVRLKFQLKKIVSMPTLGRIATFGLVGNKNLNWRFRPGVTIQFSQDVIQICLS